MEGKELRVLYYELFKPTTFIIGKSPSFFKRFYSKIALRELCTSFLVQQRSVTDLQLEALARIDSEPIKYHRK